MVEAEDQSREIQPEQLTLEEVEALRRKHFCPSVSISYSNSEPLMIVSGSKARLTDHLGRSYLDTRNNVNIVGHQHPYVIQKIQQQVQTLNTNTRYLHPNVSLLAKRLSDLLPQPLTKVFFVNSGSEANDLALRLARAYSKSKNFICVDHAYHGHTLATLEVSPYKYKKSKEFKDKSPGDHIFQVPCPDIYRGPHRGPDAAERYSAYVREACDKIVNRGEKLAAFIIEGGMSVGGVILPPPNYFEMCSHAVRSAGGIVITDEIQTGLGRLGETRWAFQHGNSTMIPDVVTIGKPFGNGMPLAAVVTTEEVSDAFVSMDVEYFNTFGGNPVSAAAGLAVLDVIENEGLVQNASTVGAYLVQRFQELRKEIDLIGDIRGSGLFIGIELVRDVLTLEPATLETSFICSTLKKKYRILTSVDGPYDSVLVVKPPLVFNQDDVDEFVTAFSNAVEDLAYVDMKSISKTPT